MNQSSITYTVTKQIDWSCVLRCRIAYFFINSSLGTDQISGTAQYRAWKKKVKALGHTVKEEWSK